MLGGSDYVIIADRKIFSFGIVPYDWLNNREVSEQVREGLRLKQPAACPDDVWEVITSCWNEEFHLRPSFTFLHQKFMEWSSPTITFSRIDTEYNALTVYN